MSKKNRLSIIENLIETQEIETQEELTQKLIELGFNVSQATVSRDINDLGLIKCLGKEKRFKYCKPIQANKSIDGATVNLFKQIILSITQAQNLIVVKTLSGNGSSAGSVVDGLHLPQILGTVAGDDTLLIVTQNSSDAELVVKSLRAL